MDNVNKPSHYRQGKVECIDGIEAALGENYSGYLQGNAIKYIWRHKYKGKPIEDIDKAIWYLNRLRSLYEKGD